MKETEDAVKAAAQESAKKAKETYDLVIPAKIDWSCKCRVVNNCSCGGLSSFTAARVHRVSAAAMQSSRRRLLLGWASSYQVEDVLA